MDEGAIALGESLRTNSTLETLELARCQIGAQTRVDRRSKGPKMMKDFWSHMKIAFGSLTIQHTPGQHVDLLVEGIYVVEHEEKVRAVRAAPGGEQRVFGIAHDVP